MKAAIGIGLVGFGILTVWAGIDKVIVFDILRSIVGGTPPSRNPTGGTGLTAPASDYPLTQGGTQSPVPPSVQAPGGGSPVFHN